MMNVGVKLVVNDGLTTHVVKVTSFGGGGITAEGEGCSFWHLYEGWQDSKEPSALAPSWSFASKVLR